MGCRAPESVRGRHISAASLRLSEAGTRPPAPQEKVVASSPIPPVHAEYVALTQLQADAFITLDADLARSVEGIVATASIDALR